MGKIKVDLIIKGSLICKYISGGGGFFNLRKVI